MANEFVSALERLKIFIGEQNPKGASISIETIGQYFDDIVSDSEIDLRIDKVFDENGGLLGFLKLSIKSNKLFKAENVKIFKLYGKIVELHEQKMAPYAKRIVDICHQYISSFHTTALERENAASTIHQLVERKLCGDVDKTELMINLLRALNGTKPTARFSQRLFELIGLLARDYPRCIQDANIPTQIRDVYFKTLENVLLKQQDINIQALIGALNGFKYFLVNFPPAPENRAAFAQRLYTCVKRLSDPPDDASRRELYRCALELLQTHSGLFGDLLLADYLYWHNLLMSKWLKESMPWDDRKTAIVLLHAFHREISKCLTASASSDAAAAAGEGSTPTCDILNFFIAHFKATLQSSKSQPYEIRIAIRGFGLMAAPCKKHLSAAHLTELLMLVMQRTESITNSHFAEQKDNLEHFPDYVQALSQIMTHVDGLSTIQLVTLRNIIVALIRHFHLLSKAHHTLTVDSLMHTFNNLMRLGDAILDDVLERIVLQGVIWTCSHKLVIDVANDWQDAPDWKDQITYKSYLPLWLGLLSAGENKTNARPIIAHKIYDHMMATLLAVFDKLDLTTRKRIYRDESGVDLQLYFCDPNYDLEPNRPADFHNFFNWVDFYCDILTEQSADSHRENFQKWLGRFVETVIRKSIQYPLVSGYLKLMQKALVISRQLKYFDDEVNDENDQLYVSIMHYLRGMISKANQTSGELQMRCLTLLFSAPTAMLMDFIMDLIPAFLIAFDVGKSNANIWIASMALSAIERYVKAKHRTSDEMKFFLRDVLPSLDPYLHGFSSDSTENVSRREKRGAKKLIKVTETDVSKFQRRIILFLGNLEPDQCLYLVRKDDKSLEIVKWNDSENVVRLKLYGQSGSVRISLDALLPRICELACTATERQKKMAACELVHAILLYVIGTNKHMGKLWMELCQRMLLLGCDGDVAVQQMFEPLIMQTMHYMSHKDRTHQDGVEILLQCQMEAMTHRTNSAVRDLAARSLREFLVWAVKQTTPEQMLGSPITISTLIEKIKLFSLDALQEKRFAAALAFNNLYRVLREEDFIVTTFWMELFYAFCMNFVMCEEYGERNVHNQPDLQQVSASLDHLVRVFRERKHIFNTSNARRHVPAAAFDGDRLQHVVLWLFQQCSSTRSNYRRKVMEMFTKLAICVDDCNASSSFLRNAQTIPSIVEVCEGNRLAGNGIAAHPNLCHIDKSDRPIQRIREWLESVHAALDCYMWLINDGLVPNVAELFSQNNVVFEVIVYFVNKVCVAPVIELLALIDSDGMDLDIDDGNDNAEATLQDYELAIEEIDKITSKKCSVLLRIYELVTAVLKINAQIIPPSFWLSNKHFFQIIVDGLFGPCDIGFETKDVALLSKLSTCTELLIVAIYRHAPAEYKNHFDALLSKVIGDKYLHWSSEAHAVLGYSKINATESDQLNGIDMMYRLQKTNRISMSTSIDSHLSLSASKVLYELFDGVREKNGDDYYAVTPKPDAQRFANQLMQISLHKANICTELIDLVLNVSELKVMGSDVGIKHGKHFLNVYKSKIFPFLLETVDIVFVVERLVQGMTVQSIQYILTILIDAAEFAYRRHANDKNQMKVLTNTLLQQWPTLLQKASNAAGPMDDASPAITHQLMLLMTQIATICPYGLAEMSKRAVGFEQWLLNIIGSNELPMDCKSCAICLLPCIIGPKDNVHEAVQLTLRKLQHNEFPMHSCKLSAGSLERAAFENVFQTILGAFTASRSPILLRVLIECTSSETKHILEHKISEHVNAFVHNMCGDSAHLLNALNIPFSLIADELMSGSLRISILKRFQLPMIRESSIEATVQFYAQHIKEIDRWCDARYSGNGFTDFKIEQALTTRICAFELIEIMAGVLSTEILTNKTSRISVALMGADDIKTGKEIIGNLSRKAYNAPSGEFTSNNSSHVELFRKYQCAAYRALCSLTSNIQTELKFYHKFLFKENPSKGRFIWRQLIDTTDDNLYTDLTLEVDRNPKLKERVVSIRRINSDTLSTKYLESQNVFDSSLSQDVTKIDLSFSTVRTQSTGAQSMARGDSRLVQNYILEKNSINDHEVMATLCAVVEHMFENNITPFVATFVDQERRRTPEWVEDICAVIEDASVHKNVRLFLAALIDNCRHRFRYYARTVTKSLLNLLTSDAFRQNMDAFAVYLAVDLLDWNQMYAIDTADEIDMAGDVIANLMRHAWHERKAVFKRKLELIKCLVEIWRTRIHPPRQFLFDSIRHNNQNKSKENICGIQLNAIVLANELIPWSESTRTLYLRTLGMCIDSDTADVYQPASQVLGMALEQIVGKRKTVKPDDEQFLLTLNKRLDALRKCDEKKFCDILYGIHKHYAPIVDKYLLNISAIVSHSSGKMKRTCLEMFLAGVTSYEDNVYREVVAINIHALLRSKEFQLLALHIVNKIMPKMTITEIGQILPDICAFSNSKYADCRDVMYEIMIFVRKTFREKVINRMASTVLLSGLSDIDAQLQRTISTYWSQHEQLPLSFHERIVQLFHDMYDPVAERNFVAYCSQLLLEPAIEHDESKLPILQDRNETETKYTEYEINTNWRSQNTTLRAPLFMASQQRQIVGGEISTTQNYLRATVDNGSLNFDPTIDPSMMQQRSISFSLQTQTSLLFSDVPQTLDRRSERIVAGGAPPSPSSTTNDKKSPYDRLRERILRNTNLMNRSMALKSIERNAYRTVMQTQQQKSAAGKVTLYRRYRFGDNPDFLINSLAMLLPLQALTRHDMLIAKHVLVTIFQTICADAGPLRSQFLISIGDCAADIFAQTTQCDPILFGALIEMALIDSQIFNIDPARLVMVSNANNMMAHGILLLEDRLNGKIAAGRSGISNTIDKPLEDFWIKLASMYYNLSEFDIVAGIFADKLVTDVRLPKAIEYESMFDYARARDLYTAIIGDGDESTPLIENDFAYQSAFRCLEKMGDWSVLSGDVYDQITDTDELWTDNWNKENLLPHYMHAEMRLVLNGVAKAQYIQNVEGWLHSPERADYMKMQFSEDLMMLNIAGGNYLQARIFSEDFFNRFLNDWNHISVLSQKVRTIKILEISKIAEIHTYCDLLLSISRNTNRNSMEKFAMRWDNTQMCPTDSLPIWESVVAYRKYISSQLSKTIDPNDGFATRASMRLTECVFDMHFKLSDLALKQKNMALAQRTMASIKKSIQSDCNSKRLTQWKLLIGKCMILQGQQVTDGDAGKSLKLLVDAWQHNVTTIAEHGGILDANPDIHINVMEQFADIGESILDTIGKCETVDELVRQQLIALTHPSDKEIITERIYDNMCNGFRKSIELAEKCEVSGKRIFAANFSLKANGIGEMYNRFGMFCQQYYGSASGDDLPHDDAERNILVSILRGMKYGSKNARLQFPRILKLPFLIRMQSSDEFNREMEAVPEWMFITWIPQILSRFAFALPCYLDGLVVRLAKMYPSAMQFPFQLAYSQYRETQIDNVMPPPSRAIVQEILKLLHNPLAEKFIASIECLNLPEKKLGSHLSRIAINIRTNEHYTNGEYHSQLSQTLQILFENPMSGPIVDKIINFKATLNTLLNLNLDRNRSEITALFRNALEILRDMRSISSSKVVDLKIFTPWLHKFHWYLGDECIELPGQYTGESRPNTRMHVKIVRFGAKCQAFPTLRRPIKLSILCSDGKTYDFLVKYGEDLRQDQGVQQMQRLITEQLAADKNCRPHNVAIETFNVIPITSFCGLLSWVEDTQSLAHMMAELNIKDITDGHHRFLQQAPGHRNSSRPDYTWYGDAVATYSPKAIADNFVALESKVPNDLLRNALFAMSSSPECFFKLRNNFAISLAAMGICNWILGIGDRHLSNLLMSKKTGKMVGIDFGMAYGMATRDLLIPELMPLRLTPQFVKMISPMETSGLIKKCMVYTLCAIRAERKTIMAAIEAFMTDQATVFNSNQSLSEDDYVSVINNFDHDAKQRIIVVNEKLMGANPIHLIASNLKGGQISRYKKYMNGYLKLLTNNPAAKMNEHNLSTDDQVNCLLELATDPSILGISFTGLSPWI